MPRLPRLPFRFFGSNVAIFVLFFGGALIEAIRGGHTTAAALWLIFGSLFITADIRRHAKRPKRETYG